MSAATASLTEMTNGDFGAAVAATKAALDEVLSLDSTVWHLDRRSRAWRLQGTGTSAELADTVVRLSTHLRSNEIVGTFGGFRVVINYVGSEQFRVASTLGQVEDSFGIDLRDRARDAAAGDSAAAMSLPLHWTADLTIDPSAAFEAVDPTTRWLVVKTVDDVLEFLQSVPFWRIGELLPADERTTILVKDLPVNESMVSSALQVRALAADAGSLTLADDLKSPPLTTSETLRNALLPPALVPVGDVSGQLGSVQSRLLRMAAGIAWAELATKSFLDANEISLEFFGLQRATHKVQADGPMLSDDACRRSVDLRNWVLAPEGSDRLLAVRQIASLRTTEPPWMQPEEIRSAAEPVFMALRSDAVAEVLRGQREVKAAAVAAAQRTAELTTSMAKGAVERALASLLAIGGVIVARSAGSLSSSQADDLRTLVAFTLIGLALWNFLLERPPIFNVARDFKSDLSLFNELLPPADRQNVLAMAALKSARNHARLVSIATPVAYLALAIVAFWIEP